MGATTAWRTACWRCSWRRAYCSWRWAASRAGACRVRTHTHACERRGAMHATRRAHAGSRVPGTMHARVHAGQETGRHAAGVLHDQPLRTHRLIQHSCPQPRPWCGRAGGLCLAVLFPRKLAVLRFESAGSSYLQVVRLYEHQLEHTAANMEVGAFGGARSSGARLSAPVNAEVTLPPWGCCGHQAPVTSPTAATLNDLCPVACALAGHCENQATTPSACSPMMGSCPSMRERPLCSTASCQASSCLGRCATGGGRGA